jgi:hypothetical protein
MPIVIVHTRQQRIAMLDAITGEATNLTLNHKGDQVRESFSQLT